MSPKGSKDVTVTSTVSVGTVYDGLVTGTYIEQAFIQGPQGRSPSLKTVRSYLESVSDPHVDRETDPRLANVRAIPFRADPAGAGQPQELCGVIDAMLERARLREGSQRLVLLGDPGSGKTPALMNCQRATAETSRNLLDAKALGPDEESIPPDCVIPVYCTSAYLGPGQPLERQLLDAFNAKLPEREPPITLDALTQLLRCCLFKLFVDNLEDLLAEGLREGLQELSRFMEAYPKHAYVIGCRTSSYHQQLGPLQTLYLADLTQDDVKQILDAVDPDLYPKVEKNPTALAVARNRSMLERFLVTGEQSILLQTRASLLEATIHEQIDPEPGGRTYAGLDRPMVEGLLETLAIRMRRDHTHQASIRQLMDLVARYLQDWRLNSEWRAVVKALTDAELLTWDKTRQGCSFADRSVEDYFAAAALAHDPDTLREVLAEVSDYWWRDVFEILVGLVPDPQTLFLELVDRDALVAANCLRFTASAVGEAVGGAVIDALVEQLGRESTDRRKFIVERIAESDHPRAPEALLMAVQREWSSAVILAATRGLRKWSQEKPAAIEQAEKSVRYQLGYKGQYICRLVVLFEPDAPAETVEKVTRRMKQIKQPPLFRGMAAVGLGLIGTEKARDVLLDNLDDDSLDDFVAWCCVEALTQFKGDAAQPVYDRLLELLHSQDRGGRTAEQARARWVYLLGWLGRGDETSALLLQALQDASPVVRARAVEAMAQLDRIDARESIEWMLIKDPNPYVQRKAADALGQIGTLDSLPVLERCLRQERSAARLAMRHGIAAIKQRYGTV